MFMTQDSTTFLWILGSGFLMSAIALVGSATFLLPPSWFARIVLPLVALAAGSLLGGALFHLIPESLIVIDDHVTVMAWTALGFVSFLVLEQFLHWHHCHRGSGAHRPVGYLILIADGLHNLLGGLAVGSAFIIDIRLGIVTWLIAAAHEVPQELGDFGLLVHSGWSRRSALAFNTVSALTFLAGALLAFGMSSTIDIAFLVPFAAGNFLYIAAADLIPQFSSVTTFRGKVTVLTSFLVGTFGLYLLALLVR